MKIRTKITAMVIAVWPVFTSVYALPIKDDEPTLRFRLKNDLRRAKKPSAGSGKNIWAWVQGAMIDFNSGYYADWIGVEGGGYYVYKLGARDGMSTRWYLADYNSFGYALGAIKIRPTENMLLKAGRFSTDYAWGSLPYMVPLIAGGTNRTLPVTSEGVLGWLAATPNLDLWAMWRTRVWNPTDAPIGIHNEGPLNTKTFKYDLVHRPRSFLAASWHNDSSRYSLGASVQHDVATLLQTILEKTLPLDNGYSLKGELTGFYARLDGLSRSASHPDKTPLVSGQLTWNTPWGGVYASAGYLKHNLDPAVDTDLGYVYSFSIDRNKEGMHSWQLGANYRPLPELTVGLAPFLTRGYQSSQRDVSIKGLGLMGIINYRVSQGPLQGLNFFLGTDIAREKRPGSALGDRLNYWDVKIVIQHDFMLK